VVGINNENVFLTEDGTWKVDVIPNVCKYYPFGVLKEADEYTIILMKFLLQMMGRDFSMKKEQILSFSQR